MSTKKLAHKKKGFTLIELMIVISILLVLIGFMIPKFSGYLDKAKKIKAMNTANQIQTAAMANYGENNGKFLETDVTNNITTLTTLTSTDISNASVTSDGQSLQVIFNSDGKPYTMDINASGNTYTLKQGTIVIFPKAP